MLVTLAVVFSAIIAGSAIPLFRANHGSIAVFIVVCIYALAPFWVLVANLINIPVERIVNRYYTNDAKRILAACPDLKIIGITGSYGKTSVKYYLQTLLQSRYDVLVTPGNFNTPLGVTRTVRYYLKP